MKPDQMLTIEKSQSEIEIIDGCRNGKSRAQRALYDRVGPRMLGLCCRYIPDWDEAEHVMIGGMVRVFDKIDQYTGEGPFEGWIRRIMVNECLMYIRKNKNMSLTRDIDESGVGATPATHYDHLQTEDLMGLIQLLPVGYRTVFNLYAIEGYTHAEIAQKLDISENTSKSQLSRARRLLREQLHQIETNELKKPRDHGI